MRTALAIAAARLAALLSTTFTKGGATSLPGLIALKIQPRLIEILSTKLAGCIVVTGTNGKTTTSRFIGNTLERDGRSLVHNQSGSNLLRGIATTLSMRKGLGRGDTWGLFEVDEATMPSACAQLRPGTALVTNLFRDQLDRYGELKRTADYLRQGLGVLPETSTVILNSDDPLVASLGAGLDSSVRYYGIEDSTAGRRGLPHAADSLTDQHGNLLEYGSVFVGHLGHYHSPDGSLERPRPDIAVTKVSLNGLTGSEFTCKVSSGTLSVTLPLPGLYNIYNALAAISVADALGIAADTTVTALTGTAAAFGRLEKIVVGSKYLFISLIKNPTGANEVIRTLASEPSRKRLLIIINDNFADGRDVSWLWDADFEELVPLAEHVSIAGTRADDMAVRMKYAGAGPDTVTVHGKIAAAVTTALEAVPEGETLYVMPTYTAMLELRQHLAASGLVKHYLRES